LLQLGFLDHGQQICVSFQFTPCLENIIVHGEVAFDAARFLISAVLSKEKSVR